MTTKPPARRGLGRGLGSLIPTAPPSPDVQGTTGETGTAPGSPGGTGSDPTYSASEAPRGTAGGAAAPASPSSSGGSAAPTRAGEASGAVAADGNGVPGDGTTVLAPVAGAWFAEIPVGQIVPNRVQPRQVFDEDAMAELVHSIQEVGLLQPIVVRRSGTDTYELVMGERRWRASQEAGLTAIPAIVRETEDIDMLRDALLENLHRSELNPLEEAAAYAQLLEDFGCTHEELAQRIGRSRPQISNTLRLMRLSPAVQRRVAAGVLSAGHARSLLAVDDSEVQDRLAQRVVAEGISVRALEEIVAVGEGGTTSGRGQRRNKPSAPGLAELTERLSDRLETRVKIDLGRTKGKISVEFATMEDLQRIADVMDPRNRQDRPI